MIRLSIKGNVFCLDADEARVHDFIDRVQELIEEYDFEADLDFNAYEEEE